MPLLIFPVFLFDPIRFFSEPPWFIRKLSRFSLRCSMLSWPLRPHSGMIKLFKLIIYLLGGNKATMKTSNYFVKLPQEASINQEYPNLPELRSHHPESAGTASETLSTLRLYQLRHQRLRGLADRTPSSLSSQRNRCRLP